ncbi:SubName: Full=Uncharacterized protein {ECO:0000313/EMBL:CCA71183.1} [Serendipita indica DSM 11827]|nr:SubName: Full=Uncharacterized protein {ECO:0000313/EMBL:CCA71183.1} [Serendipita indica DSM 11827]
MAQTPIQAADGAKITFTIRPSEERGNADHGWLKTFHTFNFADYYDPRYEGYGPLRVINGVRDSMSNVEVMKRGDVQLTSAGTGIRHSEKTDGDNQVHFLQIWSVPNKRGLTPKYYHRHFSDEEKRQGWVAVVGKIGDEGVSDSREGTGPTPVHSNLWLYATLLGAGKTIDHPLKYSKGYIHVVQTSGYNTEKSKGNRVKLNGAVELGEGDGAFVTNGGENEIVKIENIGDGEAELLFFDLD